MMSDNVVTNLDFQAYVFYQIWRNKDCVMHLLFALITTRFCSSTDRFSYVDWIFNLLIVFETGVSMSISVPRLEIMQLWEKVYEAGSQHYRV